MKSMLEEIITTRRAVYPAQYNNQEITVEELEKILAMANWAPTHRRTEPWRFKVFHSQEARKSLAEFLGETYLKTVSPISEVKHKKVVKKPLQAGCVIAICMQRDPLKSVPEWEEVAATAMAVQNMWLMARKLEIGSYWSSPALKDHTQEFLSLDRGERCLGFFYLGKTDEPMLEGTRKSTIQEKTRWF